VQICLVVRFVYLVRFCPVCPFCPKLLFCPVLYAPCPLFVRFLSAFFLFSPHGVVGTEYGMGVFK
jgi:hypothetical protein